MESKETKYRVPASLEGFVYQLEEALLLQDDGKRKFMIEAFRAYLAEEPQGTDSQANRLGRFAHALEYEWSVAQEKARKDAIRRWALNEMIKFLDAEMVDYMTSNGVDVIKTPDVATFDIKLTEFPELVFEKDFLPTFLPIEAQTLHLPSIEVNEDRLMNFLMRGGTVPGVRLSSHLSAAHRSKCGVMAFQQIGGSDGNKEVEPSHPV